MRAVRLDRIDEKQWRVAVGGHPLCSSFVSEGEAKNAAMAELVRLDGVARALLLRVRRGLMRKRT